ncbi:glutamate--tRNA ligase [Synergistales bacterium]|nr:glutamate--tRNA ligase [Synergistales bacterium]
MTNIRTRFAPSPTGLLHIGGARTALFNFLLAKKEPDGAFILRVDDTDMERSKPEYERGIMEDLRSLGLDWDEGPDKGGDYPYRQSERAHIYNEVFDSLRKNASVYPCFCSEERLDALRKDQAAAGAAPRYDGLCRHLARTEIDARIAKGEKPCWRFAMPDKTILFHDEIRGDLSFSPESIGDFVAVRGDGCPTYIFTSPIDDHYMKITHIIRGDEHIPNTARQQALLDRLDWPAPVYAHIPMILSQDRQKLSKRTGSVPIRRYMDDGLSPEALSAYLSTLSWTSPELLLNIFKESRDARELLLKMAGLFSFENVSRSSPVHDEAHLIYWQKESIKKQGTDKVYWQLVKAEPRFGVLPPEVLEKIIDESVSEFYTLPMLTDALLPLVERPLVPRLSEPWAEALSEVLAGVEHWNSESVNNALRSFMKGRGLKGKEFFHPLRLALTGRESGAPLPLLMAALGREETAKRAGHGKTDLSRP